MDETVLINGVNYPITDQVKDELENGRNGQWITLTSQNGESIQIKLGDLRRKLSAIYG